MSSHLSDQERRTVVRQRDDQRCGYCSVHESEAGAELEIDHYRPRAHGGSDELENLVYCCPTCNRLKGDYWPTSDALASGRRQLHPGQDEVGAHIQEDAECRVVALSPTGTFHRDRLRLNRPPLVALRQARREVTLLRQALAAAQLEQEQVRLRMVTLEHDLQAVLSQIARLAEP